MKMHPLAQRVENAVNLKETDQVPVGLLMTATPTQALARTDPKDFFSGSEKMLEAEVRVMRMFPDAFPILGIRPEYGPEYFASGYGYRYQWLSSGISIDPSSMRLQDLKIIDPHKDGILPRALEDWDYLAKNAPEDLKEIWGDFLFTIFVPLPIHLLADMVGFRTLYQLYYKDPKLVHELCEINCQSLVRWFQCQKDVLESNRIVPKAVFLVDETLGLTSPWIAEEFFLPYTRRITDEMRDFKIITMHGDQDISHSWMPELVKQSGINVYNFNFCHLRRLKATIGQSICLEGNISSIDVLLDGGKEDIEKAVQKLISAAGPGGGLIVSTGGGISPDVPPEKIQMMIDAVERYGKYPLDERETQEMDRFKKQYYETLPDKLADVRPLQETERKTEEGPLERVFYDVISGNLEKIRSSVEKALEQGASPEQIIQEGLAKGLSFVSEKQYKEQVFLPELVLASDVFNAGIDALESMHPAQEPKGKVVLGTIKNNLQESGISIIAAMLQSAGYKVKEIGVDVAPETFIQEAETFSADIIAVGVYVRFGWEHAKRLNALIREQRLPYRTLVGGRGLKSEKEALEMGFDAYAEDSLDIIRKADALMRPR